MRTASSQIVMSKPFSMGEWSSLGAAAKTLPPEMHPCYGGHDGDNPPEFFVGHGYSVPITDVNGNIIGDHPLKHITDEQRREAGVRASAAAAAQRTLLDFVWDPLRGWVKGLDA